MHSCPSGWLELVHDLCQDLEEIIGDHEFQVVQVKEKFGGLRFYTGPLDKDIFKAVEDRIEKAEQESFTICEVCGEEGETDNDGWWINTLCDRHRKQLRDTREAD